jgi:hypothetical protein
LSTEIRMLLGEVGRIREERRALQQCGHSFFYLFLFTDLSSFFSSEIGELLCMKSKYGPGGEFEPDWYVLPCSY